MNKTLKGGKRFVPNYIDSTFKTQEHKTEDGRNAVAVKQEKERKEKIFKESIPPYPLVELRVNDRIPEKKPPPELYPLPFVPIQNPLYPNAMMAPINMPLVKKYNITLSNLNGNLTNIGEIYEDILPKAAISQNRYTTLSERLVIANYFRSILIKRGDGEEVKIDGQKANEYTRERFEIHNLLSHINVMDINPYHKNSLTNNPYRTLPDNMVMFRSCYPIKYNTDNRRVFCAADSISSHIRIYSLSNFDILVRNKDINLEIMESDVWREIFYYEYIKENIIKRKICPNFVVLYSYYTTLNSAINFSRLRELKKNLVDVNDEKISKNNEYKQQLYNSYLVQLNEEIAKNKSTIENTKDNTIIQVTLPENVDSNLLKINYSSNSCIVAVTEGPTQNILDWATKTYQIEDGPIRRQVMTGVHSEEVWKSVIFQLLIALYVMAKHNIAFNNFKLGDNVFIKDLSTDLNNIGYWKYKLEGIDFYVPNYGFVVLIDSNFKDIENDSSKDNKYKIYGKLYNDTESIINNVTNKNYNNLSDTEFDQQFTLGGGIKPPPKIIEIMNKINKDNANEPIKHLKNIIIENFTEYLHSRVGTPIKSDELNLLQEHNKNFNIGDVIALMINPEYHIITIIINIIDNKISLATSDHNTSDIKKIICKHNYTKDELIRIEGSIEQVYSPNKKLADLDLLETYNIS